MRRRVVVTGMGAVSPLGSDLDVIEAGLREGRTGVRHMKDWAGVGHMLTRLAAPADAPELEKIPRKIARLMGRVSQLSTVATERALADAKLSPEELASGNVGLAHGSTHGSSSANEEWVQKLFSTKGLLGLSATTYLKFMSHTTAANLALHFRIRGRMMTTCAACVSAPGDASETTAFMFDSAFTTGASATIIAVRKPGRPTFERLIEKIIPGSHFGRKSPWSTPGNGWP